MDEFGPWRSLASALAWGARGPGFKSRRPDQNSSKTYRQVRLSKTLFGVQLESKMDANRLVAMRTRFNGPIFQTRLYSFRKPDISDICSLSC